MKTNMITLLLMLGMFGLVSCDMGGPDQDIVEPQQQEEGYFEVDEFESEEPIPNDQQMQEEQMQEDEGLMQDEQQMEDVNIDEGQQQMQEDENLMQDETQMQEENEMQSEQEY